MKRIITTHTLTLLFLIHARAYALPSADFTGSSFQQQGGLYLWHAALFLFALAGIACALSCACFFLSEQQHKAALLGLKRASFQRLGWPMLGILLFAAPAFFLLQQLRTAPQARITFNIQAYDGHGRYDYDDEDARVKQKHHLAHERQQPLVVPTHTKVLFSADTPPSQAHWYGASAFHHGLVGSIEKTGHYRVRCAYRCGIEHMPYPIEVEAKTEKAYLTWHKTHATLI